MIALLSCSWARISDAEAPITAMAFAPDGKSVVIGSQRGIQVRAWPSLMLEREITTQFDNVHDLAFSPEGTILAAAGGEPSEAGFVELYAWPSSEQTARPRVGVDVVYRIAWRADGQSLATAGADRTVTLLRRDGTVEQRFVGHSRDVSAVGFLSNDRLVSTSLDQSVRMWDLATGKLLRTFDNHTAAVQAVAVRPQRDPAMPMIVSIGADRTVRFWQPTIGRLVRFARLSQEPLDVVWTRDGSRAIVACRDGHVRAIDPDTARITWDRPAIEGWAYSLAIAPDGQHVLVGGERGGLKAVPLAE